MSGLAPRSARERISLCQAAPTPLDGVAVTRIHLLPAGTIATMDDRGPYELAVSPAELARQSLAAAGGRLPLDENHSTDLAAPKGGPSPARGWITALHAESDGIWGEVEWTEDGRKLVEGRAYRHISPVITHRADKRVTGILRASLVNRPNLRGLATLHGETMMDLNDKLRLQLALPDGADDAAIVAAVEGLQTSVTTHAAELAAVAKAAGREGAELTVVLNAVQERADPAKFIPAGTIVALQQELTASATRVAELESAGARAAAETFVDGAIRDGRAGVKPLRDHYVSRHMADPAPVEKEINSFSRLTGDSGVRANPPAKDGGKDGGRAGETTAEEARIVQLMGVDPAAYAATKAALASVEEAL